MAIPNFNHYGFLPPGVHSCSGEEFINTFCNTPERRDFHKAIVDIFDFAKDQEATRIFIGGSFTTNRPSPNDIDIVIVYKLENSIPQRGERLLIEGKKLDLTFCSEDHSDFIDAYICLFSRTRGGHDTGLIMINLYDNNDEWQIRSYPSDDLFEIVKRAYINRDFIDLSTCCGVLVTIHGLMSHGAWNAELVHIASSQGWIVAPFYYGFQGATTLLDKNKKVEILNTFRDWISDLSQMHAGTKISVIAHSFGSYIIGSYISGFEIPPVDINCLITTGSILNAGFKWDMHGHKVNKILNEIAPNDQWVKWMPKLNWLSSDPLYGNSGEVGFIHPYKNLVQSSSEIFDHNNVIKKDIITKRWMPFLNANRNPDMTYTPMQIEYHGKFFEQIHRSKSAP